MFVNAVNGDYGCALIAGNDIESTAKEQIINLLNTPIAENAHIRIMPDVHAGTGCVIGTSMHVTDKIVPNLVGVDIGCGVDSYVLRFPQTLDRADFEKLDAIIRNYVPNGFNQIHHDTTLFEKYNTRCQYDDADKLISSIYAPVNKERTIKSIGTLGSGNHFIELDKDSDTCEYMLNIHSGSRHCGYEVARYYQKHAIEYCKKNNINVIASLAYLEGDLFDDYMHDMELVQQYAEMNRQTIFDIILIELGAKYGFIEILDEFSTVHNYIEKNAKLGYILRKGAVAAYKNQRLVIPLNMRDGVLLCEGKGNEEWNCTAPHGAGRKYSRTAAKFSLELDDFRRDMDGIYTTCVNDSTLDESPRAYKSFNSENVEEMVDILKVYKSVYNFKAN